MIRTYLHCLNNLRFERNRLERRGAQSKGLVENSCARDAKKVHTCQAWIKYKHFREKGHESQDFYRLISIIDYYIFALSYLEWPKKPRFSQGLLDS